MRLELLLPASCPDQNDDGADSSAEGFAALLVPEGALANHDITLLPQGWATVVVRREVAKECPELTVLKSAVKTNVEKDRVRAST